MAELAGLNPSIVKAAQLGGIANRLADVLNMQPEGSDLARISETHYGADTPVGLMLYAAVSEPFSRDHAQVLIDLAAEARDGGAPDAEAGLLRVLAQREPDFYWPQYRLAVHELDRGDAAAALTRLKQVTTAEPLFSWGWFHRAIAEDMLLECDASLTSVRQALALDDDNQLGFLVQGFSIVTRGGWSAEAAGLLSAIVGHRAFSDADLHRVTAVMARVVASDAQAVDPAALAKALEDDLAEAMGSGGIVANWWPVHLAVALSAIAVESPLALSLLRGGITAVRVSSSRGQAFELFAQHLRAPAEIILGNLEHAGEAREVDALLDLAEACVTDFYEGGLAETALAIVANRTMDAAQTGRSRRLKIRALSQRGATAELVEALGELGLEELESDTAYLFADIRGRLALTEGDGIRTLDEIEAVLDRIDASDRVIDQDRLTISRLIERSATRAFTWIYDGFKAAALDGDEQFEAHNWQKGLRRLVTIFARAEGLKHRSSDAPRPSLLRDKVVVLTSPYLRQVRHYRAEQMSDLLDEMGVYHEIHDLNALSADDARHICADASVVIFQRQPATPFVLSLMFAMRALGTKILYDIDDLIFDQAHFPPPLSDYEGNIDRGTHVHLTFDCAMFQEALNAADEIVVSTKPLHRQVKAILRTPKPIHLRRNFAGYVVEQAGLRSKAKEKQKATADDGIVRIFYGSGTKAHKTYFVETVIPALVAVLKTYPQARLALVGHFPELPLFDEVRERLDLLDPSLDFGDFLDLMADHDISIAPLDISEATNAKSELKWFEAAAVGLASVVSPTRNYRDVLKDGQHALFALTSEEWEAALGRLIADADLRRNLVTRSRRLIETRYTTAYWAQETARSGMLNLSSSQPQVASRPKQRLLVVNTFFWPQSIGGATRIAESYVEDLARRYGDAFEIFVLCANANPDENSNFQCDYFWCGNVLVAQIDGPARDWGDAFDDRVERRVASLIRRWKIDIAHLHSIQILTASVAVALQAARVPIVLTLHDGWWLSEHQFLVDDNGQPFLPTPGGTEIERSTTRRMSWPMRRNRRRELGTVLRACDKVVAVSETFAEVYHRAGFSQVGVHENGVVATEIQSARRRPKGKVRLGFIGGRSEHKGYGLLCRALLKGGLSNIELVVVDHGQPYGFEREDRLGDSRVVTLGKFPQDRVEELYSRFDILAAPSIWPESYGLVTREARFAGLPVLVSDCGDIARGVEDGVDGWVLPANDEKALRALLKRLNARPTLADIRPRRPDVVSVEQAVDGLVALLHDVRSNA
ncbi:glycosyltransferase [Asticcacaulis biprosthecium]|uniref:glycosyltransferase n=1 Tax=Asticcacaulis biprosthecium TaxID=76891 RepID=UPI00058F779A|nr:glycosyltransferase [Asticcacaulis biprosthecium]